METNILDNRNQISINDNNRLMLFTEDKGYIDITNKTFNDVIVADSDGYRQLKGDIRIQSFKRNPVSGNQTFETNHGKFFGIWI